MMQYTAHGRIMTDVMKHGCDNAGETVLLQAIASISSPSWPKHTYVA